MVIDTAIILVQYSTSDDLQPAVQRQLTPPKEFGSTLSALARMIQLRPTETFAKVTAERA
jgi:hypothetical protein